MRQAHTKTLRVTFVERQNLGANTHRDAAKVSWQNTYALAKAGIAAPLNFADRQAIMGENALAMRAYLMATCNFDPLDCGSLS